MSEADKPVLCERHGVETPSTYACEHLAFGTACGFSHPDNEDPRPDAWCDLCEAAFQEVGEWNDDNEPTIKLICTYCYDEARERNQRVPPPLERGQLLVDETQFVELQRVAKAASEARQQLAVERFHIDLFDHWDYDPERNLFRFYDEAEAPGVLADVDLVGSFAEQSSTWLWAWANKGYTWEQREANTRLRFCGMVRGISRFTTRGGKSSLAEAWENAELAAWLLGAEAFYRAPYGPQHVFMLLRNLRAEDAMH